MNSEDIERAIDLMDKRCQSIAGEKSHLNVAIFCWGLGEWHISITKPQIRVSGATPMEVIQKADEALSKLEMQQIGLAREFGMEAAE